MVITALSFYLQKNQKNDFVDLDYTDFALESVYLPCRLYF